MAEYVTLKKPDGTIIYPQSVIAQVADGSITTDMIADEAITNAKIANNTITASRIAAGAVNTSELATDAVTAVKIDGTSVRKMEVLYSYRQASNSSATTNYDVPVDFSTYKYLELSVEYQCGSGSASWTYIQPLDSSKATITCRQCGIEANNTATLTGINRDVDQVIAARYKSGTPTAYDVRMHIGSSNNYPVFFAFGFGGDNGWQRLCVRPSVGASSIKYLRVQLVAPKAGAHITLWGVKGTDMGY